MMPWPLHCNHSPHRIALCTMLVLWCPGCAHDTIYWGDVHGHTSLSDGKGTPAEYFAYARDVAKLDFAIVTDHDFGHGPKWHMPPEDWLAIQDAASASTADHQFVAIAGYEWTSQSKYWTEKDRREPGLDLPFDGPARFYNHKNVYFPGPVESIYPAHDPAYASPDQLAAAVRAAGGLIHNNHPSAGAEGRDQWSYDPRFSSVIANTEIAPDIIRYDGQRFETNIEKTIWAFLDAGGRTGFVGGSDTHEGQPGSHTAVLAPVLTRQAIFDALRHRRCYATTGARIELDFRIDGHLMGEEIEVGGPPHIVAALTGTAAIATIELIRDGHVLRTIRPDRRVARLAFVDRTFDGSAWYCIRVTQCDTDAHGNPHRAWSSPIWVHRAK